MAKKASLPIKPVDTSELDKLAAERSQKLIEQGLIADSKKINEEAGGAIGQFAGIQGQYQTLTPTFFDAYEDYVDRNTLRGGEFDVDALNAIRAENQSNWEQAGNALGRLAVNVVPQIIGSTAAMLDLPGYFSAEEAANNAIVNWADSVKEKSSELLPIYEENPGGSMQMGDFAWWMTRGEGLIESIASFAAAGAGAGKLVSLGARGLSRALAATVMSAKNAKTAAGLVGQVGTATMMNQAEAVLEATQVYKTTFQNSLSKGKTASQAKEDAAKAAATTMNINRANILLNLTSAKAFLTPMRTTRQLLTAPTTLGTLGKLGLEGGQEALEETVNLVAQKAGEAKGRGEKDYMAKGMEAITTMEGLEAAFLGAIGGVGQTAITSALRSSKYGPGATLDENGEKISYNENLRQQYQKQQKVIEELKQGGVKVTDALKNVQERMKFEQELYDAANAGDMAKVAELKEKMFESVALKAFSSGTTEILEEQLKEEMAQDPEVVGPEYIQNAKQALEDLKVLEDVYNNFEEYKNVDEIFYNRASEQRLNRMANVVNTQTKNAQVAYAQKVRDIAQKYKFTEEFDQINKENGEEVSRTKQSREVPLNYVLSDLDNNQGDSEANKKTYDKFLKEVKKTPEYEQYTGYEGQQEVINKQLEQNQADFSQLTSKKYQQEYAQKQAKQEQLKALNAELANAQTIPDIEKLKDQTDDETFNKLANAKIEELQKSNAAAAKRKQVDLTMQQLRAQIANATAETYDAVDKAITDAEISQANKDQLRIEHTEHLERLKNPTAPKPNPLDQFQQGNDPEKDNDQDNEDAETELPDDLPDPKNEADKTSKRTSNAAASLNDNDKTYLIGQDANGNLIYGYERAAEGFNRAAFLSREFNQTADILSVEREEFTDTLEDNTIVLDPDALQVGTKLIISVDTEYEGEKYDPSSDTRQTIGWPLRLAELRQIAENRNVPLNELPEYIAEVPLKVALESGETVFYVHDNTWYKAENLDNTPEAIAEDKQKNYLLRKAVVAKGTVNSKVDYRSFGRLFKTADGNSLPLTEAMPDSKLVITVGKEGQYLFPGSKDRLIGKDAVILNKEEAEAGRPYAMVKVGPKQYLAIPLERSKLAPEVVQSIILAIKAHLTGDANNPVVQAIGDSTGIDITDPIGLAKYVNQFTYLFPTEKGASIENILMQGGAKGPIPSTTPILSITKTGIEFGRPGIMMNKYVGKDGVEIQKYGVVISRNFEGSAFGKRLNAENLTKLSNVLAQMISNVNIEALRDNTPAVIVINEQGETESLSYLEQIKRSTKSNVISANIGTEEEPKWIYTIQPSITFDTKFAGKLKTQKLTTKKATPKAPPVVPNATKPGAAVAPTSTNPTPTAAKTDAEVELFSETDSKGRTFTYFSTTKEKNGSIKTTFTFNRSDKDASQRATAISGIPVEKALGTKYTIDEEYIPKGFTPVGVSEIRIDKGGAGATVTFKNGPTTFQAEVKLNSNTTYDAELAALEQSTTPTPPPTAAPTAVDLVEENAEQLLDYLIANVSPEAIVGIIEGQIQSIEFGTQSAEELEKAGYGTPQEAIDAMNRALELFQERSKQDVNTITLSNGLKVKINKNTKDSEDISDDSFDDAMVTLEQDQIDTVVAEARELLLEGVSPRTQESLQAYIAADIMKRALAAKEVNGKKTVETGPIFEEHKKSLQELAAFYKANGFPKKAAVLERVVDQFPKLQSLVNQYMSVLSTGKVDENMDLDESEQTVGLEKTIYSDDWAFTINSKATASADLRKFFAFVEARNEEGEVMTNELGFPEIIPFDQVYDTLHMILANRPADLDMMMDTLSLYTDAFPWLQTVIDNIEKAPERLKNEFVSDMAKHHIGMKFIMWSKDREGNYTLQRWSSNASAIEERLRDSWNSNLLKPGSNLLMVDDEGEYFFNPEVADDLVTIAAEWKKDPSMVTDEALAQWLGNFGIVLADATYKDLRAGKYNNSGRKKFPALFTADSGLVTVLAKELAKVSNGKLKITEANILKDSAIKALAKLDAVNTAATFSNSFRAGTKTIYSYGNNNYLVNRMRDLTNYDSENKKFLNQDLIDKLQKISFTRHSLWLKGLTDTEELGDLMRSSLSLDYLSLEALKQQYTQSKDDRKLNKLTPDEHEIVKLGMFFNSSKQVVGDNTYRKVSYFYPTMSDKTTMLVVNALAQTITRTDEGVSEENLQTLYDAIVQPEVSRMRAKTKAENVKGYEPDYFYFLPGLNELMIDVNGRQSTFRDIVREGNDVLGKPEVKEQVFAYLQDTLNNLVDKKLEDWKNLGIGQTIKDDKNRITDKFTFLDAAYMSNIAKGVGDTKLRHAAIDYVFNSVIANAEMMKLFTGDPALYAKFKSGADLATNLEASFINMGKRLAGDIAPGLELANSVGSRYVQVFLQDKETKSNNVKDSVQREFFEKISSTYAKDYGKIEGSDAQEYTTWKEHVFVLNQLGRLTKAQYDTLNRKLTQQSAGVINASTKLTYDELNLVMQPMKPVYVGNLASTEENVDRRVYVKSSSFPLIPEFTSGLQIDKIRQGLETYEDDISEDINADGNPSFVRASFGTANKVGAVTNALAVFDDNGDVVDNFTVDPVNTLILDRTNFRIQQDVPYKREKDQVNVGTQERSLLFVNLLDTQVTKDKTGAELQKEYNQAYKELFEASQKKLAKRLGLYEEITEDSILEEFNEVAPDVELISKAEERLEALSKIKSPIQKQVALEEIEAEIGASNLERINFINQNFDKIIEGLVDSKINYFFDDNNEFKNCD